MKQRKKNKTQRHRRKRQKEEEEKKKNLTREFGHSHFETCDIWELGWMKSTCVKTAQNSKLLPAQIQHLFLKMNQSQQRMAAESSDEKSNSEEMLRNVRESWNLPESHPSYPPPPTVAKCFCPQRLSSAPFGSQPTEAEERRDEDSERHQDGEHQAAVVGRIWVRCSGARLDPGFCNCLGPFLPTVLASFAVLLLFLFFLVLLQTRVRLQLWHICQGRRSQITPGKESAF